MLSNDGGFSPKMAGVKTTPFLCLSMLLFLGACSSIERGVVLEKGHRVNAAVSPPIDYYWVDVRGKNRGGEEATERVQLFKPDWDRYQKGDRISPHDYDMIGAAKALTVSVKKIAKIGAKPTPAPPTPKAAKRDRPAKRKKSPPPPIPAAKPVATHVQPKPESEAARAAKSRSVEGRAVEDPAVRDLKKKIYSAKTDEEQAAAYREYRRGLYQKMRELEPSLKERIDAAEAQ